MTSFPYEMHITVEPFEIDRFRQFCFDIGAKPIILELYRDDGSSVPDYMLTKTENHESPLNSIHSMECVAAVLEAEGFTVLRRKMETVPWNDNPMLEIPRTDDDACFMKKGTYFEAHFHVTMRHAEYDKELKRLQEVCGLSHHNLHVSRNVYKILDDFVTVMVTLRNYFCGALSFEEYVQDVEIYLNECNNFSIRKHVSEFAFFDSNVAHDGY
jgi:hypothetical protein